MLREKTKKLRREEIEMSFSYRATKTLAKWMDDYFIDPIIGFLLPANIGDALTAIFALPSIYLAAVKVRSLPLTLAVICNVLRDVALGMIPFWVGDVVDVFNRSYKQNARLIVGFVEGDKGVISSVNRKALWTGALIVVFCIIICLLVSLVAELVSWLVGLFS